MKKQNDVLQRTELFDLHKHYESLVTEELEFFYKYTNFYVGMFSAILAGTITGLLSLKQPSLLNAILLVGPILIFKLSYLGYKNVYVYYRRYTQAWITSANIKRMLGLDKPTRLASGLRPPIYPSRHGGGFISLYRRDPIQKAFDEAAAKGESAEQLLANLLKIGDTLKFARSVFRWFRIGAIIVSVFIVLFEINRFH
jgi:hypothetical protein